jgi:hypothetical protein
MATGVRSADRYPHRPEAKRQYGIASICSGYALSDDGLSDDGLWRDHTWGILRGGGILETTLKRKKYFGLDQPREMSEVCRNGEGPAQAVMARAAPQVRPCEICLAPRWKGSSPCPRKSQQQKPRAPVAAPR